MQSRPVKDKKLKLVTYFVISLTMLITVPIICDMSTIHNFAEEISQIFPRHFGVGFKIIVEHWNADVQVTWKCKSLVFVT